MIDYCDWCGKDQCRRTHEQAKKDYRAALHRRALELLGWRPPPSRPRRGRKPQYNIQTLLSVRSEQLTMEQHWLKGSYLKYRRKFSTGVAWEKALADLKKTKRRINTVFPRFSREEWANIEAYRPRNTLN